MTCRRGIMALLVTLIVGVGTIQSHAQEAAITEPSDALRENFGLPSFYKKSLVTEGFPIVSSEKVSDFALREAAYIVDQMLKDRGVIRQALVSKKVRLTILATIEFTCDLPENSDLKPTAFWNVNARGYGPVPERPLVICGEENLLALQGDPYPNESSLVHELGHAIHMMGLPTIDPTFAARVTATFDSAKAEGLWKETYARTDEREYWAEGVQTWFNANGYSGSLHNIIHTRSRLKPYDPRLAGLLEEAFPNNQWRYLKPKDRKKLDHLSGFDRAMAPKFEWPDEMVDAFRRYQAKQQNHNAASQRAEEFRRGF